MAIAFAREGADVAISYLPEEEEDAQDTAEWIRKAGRKALLLPGDGRSEDFAAKSSRRRWPNSGALMSWS